MVATLKLALNQEQLQPQALGVLEVYVSLLDAEQLGRGLQQLVLMLLPELQTHTTQVHGRAVAAASGSLRPPPSYGSPLRLSTCCALLGAAVIY